MNRKIIGLTVSHLTALLFGGCIGFAIGFFMFIAKLSDDFSQTREWSKLSNYKILLEEIDNGNISAAKELIYLNFLTDVPLFEMKMKSETDERIKSYEFGFWSIASHMADFPHKMQDPELNEFKNEWMNRLLDFPRKQKNKDNQAVDTNSE